MSEPLWKRNRWRDAEYWDQVGDPANKSRVVIAPPSRVSRWSSLGIIDDATELSDEFWLWADENRHAIGNFYHNDLASGWFEDPAFRHLDFSGMAEPVYGTHLAVIFLFPTEQAAMLFKMAFL